MRNRESKRASICGVFLTRPDSSNIDNIPGLPQIRITGTWNKLDCSAAEFSEQLSSDGAFYDVSLTISFSDSSPDKTGELLAWLGVYLLVRLDYTDGTARVVGTDQFPVVLGIAGEGSPHSLKLSYKGQQPEPAKLL